MGGVVARLAMALALLCAGCLDLPPRTSCATNADCFAGEACIATTCRRLAETDGSRATFWTFDFSLDADRAIGGYIDVGLCGRPNERLPGRAVQVDDGQGGTTEVQIVDSCADGLFLRLMYFARDARREPLQRWAVMVVRSMGTSLDPRYELLGFNWLERSQEGSLRMTFWSLEDFETVAELGTQTVVVDVSTTGLAPETILRTAAIPVGMDTSRYYGLANYATGEIDQFGLVSAQAKACVASSHDLRVASGGQTLSFPELRAYLEAYDPDDVMESQLASQDTAICGDLSKEQYWFVLNPNRTTLNAGESAGVGADAPSGDVIVREPGAGTPSGAGVPQLPGGD